MSIRKTIAMMAIMVTALVIMVGALQASQTITRHLFDYKLEPLEPTKAPGVIDMLFEFTPTKLCSAKGCTEAEIRVIPKDGLEYLGPQTWTQQVKYGETYSRVIQVSVPPNDTCGIWIELHSPVYHRTRAVAYFTSTADSVEFWKGYPQSHRRGPDRIELARAAMTEEERREVVDVRIDLNLMGSRLLKMAVELVPNLKPTDQDSVFTAQVTRDDVITLNGWGAYTRILKQPPPPNKIAALRLARSTIL